MSTQTVSTPKAPDFGQGGRTEMLAVIQYLVGQIAAIKSGADKLANTLSNAEEITDKVVANALSAYSGTEKQLAALDHYRDILASDIEASQTPTGPEYFDTPRLRSMTGQQAVGYVLNDLDSILADDSLSAYDAIYMARQQIKVFAADNMNDFDTARAYASHLAHVRNRAAESAS